MTERMTSVDAPAVTDSVSVASILILLPLIISRELLPGIEVPVISSTVWLASSLLPALAAVSDPRETVAVVDADVVLPSIRPRMMVVVLAATV
jgi:hypothetical protein